MPVFTAATPSLSFPFLQLFLNNDCDTDCIALFEHMVTALRKSVLLDHTEKQWITPQQSSIIQHYSLQVQQGAVGGHKW